MATFDPLLRRCLLCGSENLRMYHRDGAGIAIFRCRSCRVQFMNPQYTDAHLAEYYSRYTREEPEWDEALTYLHDSHLALLESYLPSKGKLLDVGAGKGHLLRVALRRGWSAEGYEIDAALAGKLAGKIGTRVRSGDFAAIEWRDGQFDAVAMHHVLEHVKNPEGYLRAIRRMLRDGGILFLAVPNINSLSSRMKLLMEKAGVRRKNVGKYYDTGHHLLYFTPATLKETLACFGFQPLFLRSGHRVRPRQSPIKRFLMRNVTERNLLHSTFLCVARKQPER